MCDLKSCNEHKSDKPLPKVADDKRRAFLKGMITLPLAVVLADPVLAQSAAHTLQMVTLELESGKTAGAYLAMPKKVKENLPTVILIHEWWGLNDQIKAVANDLAQAGFMALAVDLYNGKVASTREDANEYRQAMDSTWATEALAGWVDWLRNHKQSNGKVGTLGWCFGGGWSLNASLAAPVDATIIYYGSVKRSAEELKALKGPVMGHFGTLDKRINAEMVGQFQREMEKAGKDDLTIHWYTADHAFANPTGSRYDEDDAALAWTRTLTFLHQHLT
ncbi:dienelactone hydrolase family protein [Pontibacterium granulatum]|uniref:dienelactone hydrolase family protein n=1 Tax=Pontibacterium granulatum TaxID=2036029 RepID=UPI00249B887E|nr:dienelactone hydrolase family protein [Pontibacterium granulatum]MDI3325281.1 dienelactone hydrolase family protein [Pontibacterium granulatum]